MYICMCVCTTRLITASAWVRVWCHVPARCAQIPIICASAPGAWKLRLCVVEAIRSTIMMNIFKTTVIITTGNKNTALNIVHTCYTALLVNWLYMSRPHIMAHDARHTELQVCVQLIYLECDCNDWHCCVVTLELYAVHAYAYVIGCTHTAPRNCPRDKTS